MSRCCCASAFGLLLGLLCVQLFDLTGMTRAVVLLGSAAPIGFSAVVVASRESLNRDLAASAASISVLLGLVYVPLALWLLPPLATAAVPGRVRCLPSGRCGRRSVAGPSTAGARCGRWRGVAWRRTGSRRQPRRCSPPARRGSGARTRCPRLTLPPRMSDGEHVRGGRRRPGSRALSIVSAVPSSDTPANRPRVRE